ncbi:MAG: spoIIIJ-associated protein [Candidatus Peribacteria bacterium]|nr:spoIIIJ-associated protein [Candidatus Peribacteria bacterium]
MNADLIKDILSQLLTHLNLPVSGILVQPPDEGMIRVEIQSSEPSRIIGWHGETLGALQNILKSIVRTKEKMEKAPFIVLDVDGYRKAQEDKVCRIAEQKADFVRRTGSRIALAPMSPYFRRIVHTFVANHPSLSDLTTESVGEGEYRQIVMKLKNPKQGQGGYAKVTEEISEELSPVMAEDDLGNLDV